MPYTPHTLDDIRGMLEVIGLPDLDALFAEIPETIRNPHIEVPPPLCEEELREDVARLVGNNRTTRNSLSFLGGGAYERIRPSVIDRLLSRAEFYTSYTPYQAEVSQGTLQYIFEFQSLITALTGMEVANASMYDGASALAEAALMAMRLTRKKKILYAQTLHPRWIETLKTYLTGIQAELVEIPAKEGVLDLPVLSRLVDKDTAAVLVQHPNFFGYLENLGAFAEIVHSAGAMWIQASDPLAMALLKSPGQCGADIAVGELQSLGLPLSFGGPYGGYFAVRYKDVRQMPGRLVGKTVDAEGKTGYVLTLQTREQHIRRDKATSNICTNQSLCALAATIYMSLLGPHGLREVAQQNTDKAHYLAEKLLKISGVKMLSDEPFFNEFTLVLDRPAATIVDGLSTQGILAGVQGSYWTGSDDRLIVCVTETKKKAGLDRMAEAFAAAMMS